MFYVQFEHICREKGTTPTAVVRKLGISSSKITAWKRGSKPKMDMLATLAAYLEVDVSVFYGSDSAKIDVDKKQNSHNIEKSAAERLGDAVIGALVKAGKIEAGEPLTPELVDSVVRVVYTFASLET